MYCRTIVTRINIGICARIITSTARIDTASTSSVRRLGVVESVEYLVFAGTPGMGMTQLATVQVKETKHASILTCLARLAVRVGYP